MKNNNVPFICLKVGEFFTFGEGGFIGMKLPESEPYTTPLDRFNLGINKYKCRKEGTINWVDIESGEEDYLYPNFIVTKVNY